MMLCSLSSLIATSPAKNVEAKSNDINAMMSPEGERVALGKVCKTWHVLLLLSFYLHIHLSLLSKLVMFLFLSIVFL